MPDRQGDRDSANAPEYILHSFACILERLLDRREIAYYEPPAFANDCFRNVRRLLERQPHPGYLNLAFSAAAHLSQSYHIVLATNR